MGKWIDYTQVSSVADDDTIMINGKNLATKQALLSELNQNLSDKVGWAKVENGQLKLYADSAMTSLLQTLTLPSGGSSSGSTTDTNTTYTFSISGNTITITASDGTTQTITVPTGSGSSGVSFDSSKVGIAYGTSSDSTHSKYTLTYNNQNTGFAVDVYDEVATTSNKGLMSATDKTRLNTLTDSYIQSLVSGGSGSGGGSYDPVLPLSVDITLEEASRWIKQDVNFKEEMVIYIRVYPNSENTATGNLACSVWDDGLNTYEHNWNPWGNYYIFNGLSGAIQTSQSYQYVALAHIKKIEGAWTWINGTFGTSANPPGSLITSKLMSSMINGVLTGAIKNISIGDSSAGSGTRYMGVGTQFKVWGR